MRYGIAIVILLATGCSTTAPKKIDRCSWISSSSDRRLCFVNAKCEEAQLVMKKDPSSCWKKSERQPKHSRSKSKRAG